MERAFDDSGDGNGRLRVLAQDVVHPADRRAQYVKADVRVNVDCDRYGAVPEQFHDGPAVDSLREEQRRARVA
jgi:hypothetical protein